MKYTNQELEFFYHLGLHKMYSMDDAQIPISIKTFHPSTSRVHIEKDNWFCGIRADHFVITEGWDESDWTESILIMGNHEGTLRFTLLKDPERSKSDV